MICAGVDAGSRAIKAVLMEAGALRVIARGVVDQGVDQAPRARGLLERLLAEAAVERPAVARVVATGYARASAGADLTITEVTCHAVGVHRQAPEARAVVEVGGQDSKLLRLDGRGGVRDFAMNDRCAAGTGRFLELVSQRLEIGLHELGELARRSTRPAEISSTCAVFAETEIVGLLASGARREDVAAGVQRAISARIASLAHGNLPSPIIFTGGVALIPGMAEALAEALGQPVRTARDPQMTGAVGAAILACRGE